MDQCQIAHEPNQLSYVTSYQLPLPKKVRLGKNLKKSGESDTSLHQCNKFDWNLANYKGLNGCSCRHNKT